MPRNLDEVRAVTDPVARALAAAAYIEARESAIEEARRIRDAAVREVRKTLSISKTAAACGLSPATVKAVTR